MVHRILQSLASRALVQPVHGDTTYSLGPAAIGLGTKAWSQLDVRTVAAPVLRRLRDRTRETATLSVLVGHRRVYLDQYESPQEATASVSTRRRISRTPMPPALEAASLRRRGAAGLSFPAFGLADLVFL